MHSERPETTGNPLGRFLIFLFILILPIFFTHCARESAKTWKKSEETILEPEDLQTESKEYFSPQREASFRILEIGQQELAARETDKAIQTIQEAINIDPQNGIAYYLLAKGHYIKKNYAQALGILEKASLLLEEEAAWKNKIETLKNIIVYEEKPPVDLQKENPSEEDYF